MRVVQDQLGDDNIGAPGLRGQPVKTAPIEPGYSYHSESNMDLMQPAMSALAEAFETIDLPLRSIENEWGPGQVECTFAARDALEAADNMVLFRTATKQIVRRMGCFATFMCRPGLKNHYSSGWHLHQSLTEARRRASRARRQPVHAGARGRLPVAARAELSSAASSSMRCRRRCSRRRPSTASAASGRIRWRPIAPAGATITAARCCACSARPAIPRAGSRTAAASRRPIPISSSPRRSPPGSTASTARPIPARATTSPMPPTVRCCRRACRRRSTRSNSEPLFKQQFGEVFIDYYLKLKRNEAGRYQRWIEEGGVRAARRRNHRLGAAGVFRLFLALRPRAISATNSRCRRQRKRGPIPAARSRANGVWVTASDRLAVQLYDGRVFR